MKYRVWTDDQDEDEATHREATSPEDAARDQAEHDSDHGDWEGARVTYNVAGEQSGMRCRVVVECELVPSFRATHITITGGRGAHRSAAQDAALPHPGRFAMTNKEAVRLLVDKLVESPLSDDELDGVVDRSMDLIIYGATMRDRACGEQLIRMCAEIAKRRDAAAHGCQPDPATPSAEPAPEPTAAALSSEAIGILDEMRNSFAYDMSSDSRIAEVERILFVLGKAP